MENIGSRPDEGVFPLQFLRGNFARLQTPQILGALAAFDQFNVHRRSHRNQSTTSQSHCQAFLARRVDEIKVGFGDFLCFSAENCSSITTIWQPPRKLRSRHWKSSANPSSISWPSFSKSAGARSPSSS